MTLLTAVQRHCQVHGLANPGSVVGNTDVSVRQILGVANSLLDEITDQTDFQGFVREAAFTLAAAESQGTMESLAPGILWMLNGTFYDRSQMRPVYGPVNAEDWQQLKALPDAGPWYKYRIREDELLIHPTPSSSLSDVAFEYASKYGVVSSTGIAKEYFTEDTDTFVLPEKILIAGIAYRWKQVKGFPYEADEKRFWSMLTNAITRDGSKPTLNLAHTQTEASPGIFVPRGSWDL